MSGERKFVKLNTSLTTGSNAGKIRTDADGNTEGVIELRLPDTILNADSAMLAREPMIELQTSKMRLSLMNTPIAAIPIRSVGKAVQWHYDNAGSPIRTPGGEPYAVTDCILDVWPYIQLDSGVIEHSKAFFYPFPAVPYFNTPNYMMVMSAKERFDTVEVERDKMLYIRNVGTIEKMLSDALSNAMMIRRMQLIRNEQGVITDMRNALYSIPVVKVRLGAGTFSITYSSQHFIKPALPDYDETGEIVIPVLEGTPGCYGEGIHQLTYMTEKIEAEDPNEFPLINTIKNEVGKKYVPPLYVHDDGTDWGHLARPALFSIVANRTTKDTFPFLPWKEVDLSKVIYENWDQPTAPFLYPYGFGPADETQTVYILDSSGMEVTYGELEHISTLPNDTSQIHNYCRDITFTWNNIPTLLISPIASIVLTIEGLGIETQIYPVNKTSVDGSSIITTVPIIECYNPLTSSLADLHDEMIISRDVFETAANFKLDPNAHGERTVRFRAQYVLKDGSLHQLYIPPNGIFSLQLTYGIYY